MLVTCPRPRAVMALVHQRATSPRGYHLEEATLCAAS